MDQLQYEDPNYTASGKLEGKVTLITNGNLDISRAIGLLFAREGADVVITYLDEPQRAEDTQEQILALGGKCLAIAGDTSERKFCQEMAEKTVLEFGKIDVLVNSVAQVSADDTSTFYIIEEVSDRMMPGGSIINSGSTDAMISFTRSLNQNLASKGIRVNTVGTSTAKLYEIAYSYLYLASDASKNTLGEVIQPNEEVS